MPFVVTHADLLLHLKKQCTVGVNDVDRRIAVYMDGVREDLESAAADLDAARSRTAASDLEDAAMLMGEALAFAYGYKVPAGEGHHWNAIRVLALYVQSSIPTLARLAGQLDMLRIFRHRVKYDGAEAPMAQVRLYYAVIDQIYRVIKNDAARIALSAHQR